MLRLIINTKFRLLKGILFDRNNNARIRNISMGIVLVLMIYSSYLFFHNLIFSYVINLEEIGYLLIERLVSMGFLTFFFLLIISSFVIALASLFRSAETEYLFSTPLPELVLFTNKYIDIVIYSSWAILVMAVPILYSYAKVRNFGTMEYALTGFVVLIPFVIISTALGTLIALLMVNLSKRLSLKYLLILTCFVFFSLIFLLIHFSQTTQLVIPFTEDFRALNVFINNFQLNSHPLTPNFWLIQSLRALVLHDYKEFFLYGSALLFSAVFALALLYSTAERVFFNNWLVSNEISSAGKRKNREVLQHRAGFFSKPTSSQPLSLLKKDILIFIREPGQWSQLFLILALLALYFVNLHLIPDEIEIEQWRTIISIMNFGFCGLVLATLAIRFVFPSISMEGDSIWIIGSAPLSPATLFKEKFWFSFVIFLIITEIIALISGSILKLEGLYLVLTIGGIFLMSIAFSSLAVGFGAIFPDFSERNPSRIASSPGGILTIVILLFYLVFMMALLAIPSYKYTIYQIEGGAFPSKSIAISTIIALILNSVTIVMPLWLGVKSLSKREY